MKHIPYNCQTIDESDISVVHQVMESAWLTQGPMATKFEQAVGDYCQVEHVIAVSSATAALHIACLALGLGEGDILWTSPISFSASANCGMYCGAQVDFVDIDIATGNLSVQALEDKLIKAQQEDCLPSVLVVVHYAGQSCDMQKIHALANQYKFKVIEDAAQALGATYQGRPVGDCRYSDCCVFSLHPTKTITAAEGGLVTCRDGSLAQKLASLKTHGLVFDKQKQEEMGGWYRDQVWLGYNYRMSELHGALGLNQLPKCDGFVERRRSLAQHYHELLAELPLIRCLNIEADTQSSWHLFVILVSAELGVNARRKLYDYLHQFNIGAQVHYIPIFMHSYYQQFGFLPSDYPNAMDFYNRCLSIPLYPTLTHEQQHTIVNHIKDFLMTI